MNLSDEDWKEWSECSQTKEFIKIIEKGIIDEKVTREFTLAPSISNDAVARNLARSEGICEGLKSVIGYIFELRKGDFEE